MSKYAEAIASIPMPPSIAALPIDPVRKYPVPWFVTWLDGKPEFRVADGKKLVQAVRERLCWVCGTPLTPHRVTFPIGPMCTVNRVTAEPPAHRECATYSVRACPFLARPHMVRREGGIPEEASCAGHMILRNPGVTCLWTTRAPGATLMDGPLFSLWPPTEVSWWREGRIATQAEVREAVASGLPSLEALAQDDDDRALLVTMTRAAEVFWPA